MRLAQSYIVRVYARSPPGVLMGTVEIVRTGERRGFSSPEELLCIVAHGRHIARPRAIGRRVAARRNARLG